MRDEPSGQVPWALAPVQAWAHWVWLPVLLGQALLGLAPALRPAARLLWQGPSLAVGALSLAVNVGLSLLLIPRLGILGAALATAAGQVAFALASYALTQRLLAPFRFDGQRAATVPIVGVVYIALLSCASTGGGIAGDIRLRLLALVTFVPLLVGLGAVSRADLRELARTGQRRWWRSRRP